MRNALRNEIGAERGREMKYKILVAHNSDLKDFQHEFTFDTLDNDCTHVVDELIELLNEENFRDCIFKAEEIEERQGQENPDQLTSHNTGRPKLPCSCCEGALGDMRIWNGEMYCSQCGRQLRASA